MPRRSRGPGPSCSARTRTTTERPRAGEPIVRPRHARDLAACATVLRVTHERDGYPAYWPADPEGFVAGERTLAAWVAVRGEELLGHVAVAAIDPGHDWSPWLEATGVAADRIGVIARFFVVPAARGTGVAGALFDTAVTDARARGLSPVLDVAVHNDSGIAFYARRGWRRVGETMLALRDPPGATLPLLLYAAPADGDGDLDIDALEQVAARAVPAAEVAEIGGWLARATDGVRARRANSVLARGDDPGCPLGSRIAAVERFYADRGRSACFQLTPGSRPPGLAAELRRRGYVRESPTLVQVGTVHDAMAGEDAAGIEGTVAGAHDATWLSTWTDALGTRPALNAGPIALWRRVVPDTAYVTVRLCGSPVGVGMAVRDGRFLGIFNMATLPDARRRGIARAALRALVAWGARGGADRVYLQVDVANDGALALYEGAGLRTAYEYAYLRRELTGGA